jgi:hypothetical protein
MRRMTSTLQPHDAWVSEDEGAVVNQTFWSIKC